MKRGEKMGWSNYLVSDEYKVVFKIGKILEGDLFEASERLSALFELLEYLSSKENPKLEVIKYLYEKTRFIAYEDIFPLMLANKLKDWRIVNEEEADELDEKGYTIIYW